MTTNTSRAFFIDPHSRERPVAPVSVMGPEAFDRARMAAVGLPVPHAFVLGAGFWPPDDQQDPEAYVALNQTLAAQLRRLENATRLTYGGSRRPLLLSVRSDASMSMPGAMDTIVNVGLNETSVRGLLRTTGNPRLTWDAYRRLIQSFAEVVDSCPSQPFDGLVWCIRRVFGLQTGGAGVEGLSTASAVAHQRTDFSEISPHPHQRR
jgi:phosphoenolpyruvate synthase/pyruvate phosphate dikinase